MIDGLGSSVVAVIERTVVVVVRVDVVNGAGIVAVDVNCRVAIRGVQMRHGEEAGNRKRRHGENRQPPLGKS